MRRRKIMSIDDNDLMDELETITLTDETGEETDFIILDKITDNGKEYILAIESELIDEEDAEAAIFRKAASDGEEDVYELIEDDNEFDKIASIFQLSSDEYDVEIDD
jgi:uncharacterized protein YrzB (UPF0473 family)